MQSERPQPGRSEWRYRAVLRGRSNPKKVRGAGGVMVRPRPSTAPSRRRGRNRLKSVEHAEGEPDGTPEEHDEDPEDQRECGGDFGCGEDGVADDPDHDPEQG